MNKISLLKRLICALSIVIFASCDDEFNDVGADIVGGDVHSDLVKLDASLVAYDRATGPVQSNNLTVNTLGVYNNPVFGKTTASYVTQVSLASPNPTFYDGIVLDSVYLYVPYYSRLTGADATTGKTTYELDSIFGSKDAQLTLSIKRNGFFLRGADAASGGVAGQKYYSSDKSLVDAQAGVSLLADGKESQSFSFSAAEIERSATPKGATAPKVVEKLAPGMFINLNKAVFEQAILKAPSGKLLNNSIFTEYFRGIYFKAEQTGGGQSIMGTPNFAKGVITIKYRDKVPTTVNGKPDVVETAKTLTLNLTGNSINFFENQDSSVFTTALATSNTAEGDDRLYVKGGEGAMAFLNISRNSLKDLMRENNAGNRVLINEANIVFNVDLGKMFDSKNPEAVVQPQRLYLYDLKNRRPLFDYSTDVTTNNINPKKNKAVHGGLAEYNSDDRVVRYKIRVTDFINNIVNKDSLANVENIQLGLVVTETINVVTNASLKNPLTELGQNVSIFPVGSVMHPFGTVLFGSNIPEGDDDYNKRLKLEIFYTKPKQ
jgi:hypothetical protein